MSISRGLTGVAAQETLPVIGPPDRTAPHRPLPRAGESAEAHNYPGGTVEAWTGGATAAPRPQLPPSGPAARSASEHAPSYSPCCRRRQTLRGESRTHA